MLTMLGAAAVHRWAVLQRPLAILPAAVHRSQGGQSQRAGQKSAG